MKILLGISGKSKNPQTVSLRTVCGCFSFFCCQRQVDKTIIIMYFVYGKGWRARYFDCQNETLSYTTDRWYALCHSKSIPKHTEAVITNLTGYHVIYPLFKYVCTRRSIEVVITRTIRNRLTRLFNSPVK